jgi:hypothetical protein
MFSASTLPPDGNGEVVPEDELVSVAFVSYDEDGRITATRQEAVYFLVKRYEAGERVAKGEADGLTHYVVNEKITLRPAIPGGWDTTTLAPGDTATWEGLPACKVEISGPIGDIVHEHEGGDLQLSFLVPGSYNILVEPWPHPISRTTLEVTE